MRLTLDQKTWIITNFKVFGSYSRLRRAYCTHFSQIRYPSINTVKSITKKFELLGSVQDGPRSGRSKTATNDEKVEEVRLLLENNAGMSLRRNHLATGISLGSVHTIATKILNL